MAKNPDDLAKEIQTKSNAVSNIFRGQSNNAIPLPKKSSKINLPTSIQQPTPATPTGIGSQFVDRLVSTTPEQPVVEEPAIISPEDVVEKYKRTLVEAGFKDNDDNLEKFIELNPDTNTTSFDFTGLDQLDNPVEVDSPINYILDTVKRVPIIQVLASLKKPLEILGEGLSRYEAAKVAFLKNAPLAGGVSAGLPVASALSGQDRSKFAETAGLKQSDMPELGDFLREMGVPEEVAATGGVALDILTDLPVSGGLGALLKHLGKGSIKEGAKVVGKAAPAELKKTLLNIRSNEAVKVVEDTLKGKSRFDIGPNPPALKQAFREARGGQNVAVTQANEIGNYFTRTMKAKPELEKTINNAISGDIESLGKLDVPTQTYVKQSRQIIDGLSKEVRSELDNLIQTKQLTEDETEHITNLMKVMDENQGVYVRRYYEKYLLGDKYKPKPDTIKTAKEYLLKEGHKSDEADKIIDNIINDIPTSIRVGKNNLKIKRGPFLERKDIPEEIRQLLGEVTNPAYRVAQTTLDLADANAKFKIFRNMKELGYFSPTKTKEYSELIPPGGPLGWGAIEGMYTSPEIKAILETQSNIRSSIDKKLFDMANLIKGGKVVLSPKGHGHNILGNTGWFSLLADTSPMQYPKQSKEIISKMFNVKKVMDGKLPNTHPDWTWWLDKVEKGIVKNEIPNADNIKFLEDIASNPFDSKPMAGAVDVFKQGAKNIFKFGSEALAAEDQFFKLLNYEVNTNIKKMPSEKAVEEVFKWFINPSEASKLASTVRGTTAGLMLTNPYLTFRTEAHRIFLNAMKESPRTRFITGMYMSSRAAWNAAILGMMGMGLKDISETFMARPELASDIYLNPADPEGRFDINTEYIDPFNTKGMFAPLMWAAGASGINPFDWLLDFTTLSPEFGYQNMLLDVVTPAITGKGKFQDELSLTERVGSIAKGILPSSFGTDVPKFIAATQEGETDEAVRRAFRFVGLDIDKRNPEYLRPRLRKRLDETVLKNEDPTAILRAIKALGFDETTMYRNSVKKVGQLRKKARKENKPLDTSKDKTFDTLINFINGTK